MLKNFSSVRKKRNVPNKTNNTPRVELLEAAWARVYTSGKRSNPMALIKLKMLPMRIIRAVNPSFRILLNYKAPFDEPGQCYGTDERKNPDQ